MTAAPKACKHFWIRYVLDDSPPSHAQQNGIDDRGRPYRDVPMRPMETFAYAATIGSDFARRVVEATCRDCGVKVIDELPSAVQPEGAVALKSAARTDGSSGPCAKCGAPFASNLPNQTLCLSCFKECHP